MRVRLKPVEDQVIVITGASSGIGLVTARMAARRGARVVLAARDEQALRDITDGIVREGGQAEYVVADVAREKDIHAIASIALERFGRIDTWVNNAGISIYGRLLDTPLEDHRQLFETDYWGVVNGSRVAVEYLREHGGALINIGSALSDRSIPLQGAYSAAKHAVKAFTQALRMELEADRVPISITLIKPGAVDTPYEDHARSYLGTAPTNPPPIYAPETVARAILYAAENRVGDLIIGSGGQAISWMGRLFPRAFERVMEAVMIPLQQGRRQPNNADSLYGPVGDGRERSGHHSLVREHSYSTEAQMHPVATAAVAIGLGILAVSALQRSSLRNTTAKWRQRQVSVQPRRQGSSLRAPAMEAENI